MNDPAPAASTALDYGRLLQQNLDVFNERDPARRAALIADLHAEDVAFFDPDAAVRGRPAFVEKVAELLGGIPAEFSFTPGGPVGGHHDVGRLDWRLGPAGGPAVATGTDVAHFADGRIHLLFTFIDPAPR